MEITTTYLLGLGMLLAGGLVILVMLANSPSVISFFSDPMIPDPDTDPVSPLDPTGVPLVKARSADAGPPAGAVEWVSDIISSIGNAPDGIVLSALFDGDSRDAAQARWIAELEKTHVK